MQIKSKEHYDLINEFERIHSNLRHDKEGKFLWSKGLVYQSGDVNRLFIAFRNGYAVGRVVYMMESQP